MAFHSLHACVMSRSLPQMVNELKQRGDHNAITVEGIAQVQRAGLCPTARGENPKFLETKAELLELIGDDTHTKESRLRRQMGNNPDTSKALRSTICTLSGSCQVARRSNACMTLLRTQFTYEHICNNWSSHPDSVYCTCPVLSSWQTGTNVMSALKHHI